MPHHHHQYAVDSNDRATRHGLFLAFRRRRRLATIGWLASKIKRSVDTTEAFIFVSRLSELLHDKWARCILKLGRFHDGSVSGYRRHYASKMHEVEAQSATSFAF